MLKTSAFTPETEYTLTVNNIKDQSPGGNTIEAATQRMFTVALTPGYVLWEFYADIPGTSVDELGFNENYPDNPARREFLSAFTTSPRLTDLAETFGARVSGWITPEETGNYEFFIRSDDASLLLLSADDDPNGATPIADEPACCNPFREPGDGVTQTSAPTALVAGRRYFLQALYKEATGGDFVEVAWRKEGDTTPADQLRPIPGQFLSVYRSASAEEALFSLPILSAGEITLNWSGTAVLQESVDLKTWTDVPGNPVSGFKVTPSSGERFYRLSQ